MAIAVRNSYDNAYVRLGDAYQINSTYGYDRSATMNIEVPMDAISWGNQMSGGGNISITNPTVTTAGAWGTSARKAETATEWLRRTVDEVCDSAFRDVKV